MSNLDNTETQELIQRYEYLIKKYVPLAVEVGEMLDKFGKIRQELQVISAELVKRNFTPEDPEKLRNLIEETLKKTQKKDDGSLKK